MTVRVVFFGNSASNFTARHFEALLAAPAELVGVVDVPAVRRNTTNPSPDSLPDLVNEARQRYIPIFEPDSPDEAGFFDALRELQPDLFIAAGYALILKAQLLGVPRLMAVNFHASLLPAYRGKHPVFWALRNDERWAGLSVHVMERGIDTGDLIYQVKVRTRRDDSVASLYERIMERSLPLVERLIVDAAHGSILRRAQPEGTGSYYSGTTEVDFRLDWNWPAEKIRRYITVTPGRCFVELKEGRLCFIDARSETSTEAVQPGTVLRIGRRRAVVAANPGAVSIDRVWVGESRPESLAAFCRSRGMLPGDMLSG